VTSGENRIPLLVKTARIDIECRLDDERQRTRRQAGAVRRQLLFYTGTRFLVRTRLERQVLMLGRPQQQGDRVDDPPPQARRTSAYMRNIITETEAADRADRREGP
jgi:hypothetical protein